MRRLTTIIIAGAALLLSGCVIDDGTPKKYQVIATQLWEASRSDLNRINDILELMLDVETLLSIEDATERETFQHNQFRSSTIYYDNNVIRIVTPTKYGTSYTTTITTNGRTLAEGGTWSILRTGGWEYRLEAKGQNGKVVVDFSDLYHNESHGTASVELSYDYSGLGSALCITYMCSMTMSDTDKSVEKPLHITTTTTTPIRYSTNEGMTAGSMEIEWHDLYHDTAGDVFVHIDPYGEPSQHFVTIEFLDWCDDYYYDRI